MRTLVTVLTPVHRGPRPPWSQEPPILPTLYLDYLCSSSYSLIPGDEQGDCPHACAM